MTPCIKLQTPDGSTRYIANGQPYMLAPGEKRVGVDKTCGDGRPVKDAMTAAQLEKAALLKELNAELGSGAGDWVKLFAKPTAALLNKQNCMSCEVRKVVLNAYARLKARYGLLEALRMIKDLEVKSLAGGKDEEILTRLKAWLNA